MEFPSTAPPPPSKGAALVAAAAALSRAAASSAVALPVGAQRVVAAGDAPAVEASNWNASGWGWEDRDCTAWARARLREVLVGFDVDVPGAHIAVVDVEDLVGEASVTLRKVRATCCTPPPPSPSTAAPTCTVALRELASLGASGAANIERLYH